MCLLFFALDSHPSHPLIVAANRDEYYDRPTQPLHQWPEYSSVFAGRDLLQGGTWLGVTRSGRWAAVTNYRETEQMPGTLSRGTLVKDYLASDQSPSAYMQDISRKLTDFNGFNLVVGQGPQALYISNRQPSIKVLHKGIYGLSNHLLDTPWPKVTQGKDGFSRLIGRQVLDVDSLFDLLHDRHTVPDQLLPDTGRDAEWERLLSSAYISGKTYGTRSSTVLLLNSRNNRLKLEERTFESTENQNPETYSSVSYEFAVTLPSE